MAAPRAGAETAALPPDPLRDRLAAVMRLDPGAPVVEFGGRWHTWGELAVTADSAGDRVPAAGARVGVLLRNHPAHVAVLAGLLRDGACVVTINPGRGADRVRADIAALDLAVLVGDAADLAALVPGDAAGLILATGDIGDPLTVHEPHSGNAEQTRDAEPARDAGTRPGVAVEMLTSGTTGPPKRVPLGYEMLARVLAGAKHYEANADQAVRLRSGVAIVNAPLVHVGGLFRVLQCLSDGRPFCLLERFTVEGWLDAVRRHRPRTASLVPAALRMVLDADLDPADLSSIRSVVSGTAPLAPEVADAFGEKYGIPVLISYGATEFGGGVAGWNLADHQKYWAAKRGSVGRAHPGCDLRVIDANTGVPVAPGADGLLEVKGHQFGDGSGWVRTTDLARVDADGFLWIVGRADQVIIRGGFKVHPDDVRVVLERDPRVLGAAVVGRDDPRLGAVPVAAVELRPGAGPVTAGDIRLEASRVLARYELPTEIRILDTLPRTPSGKPDLAAIRDLFIEADAGASTRAGGRADA